MNVKKLASIVGLLLLLSTGCVQDQFGLTGGWSGVSGSDDAFYVATKDGRVVGIDGAREEILYSRGGNPLTYPPIGEDAIGPIYGTPHYDGDRVFVAYFDGKVQALNAADLSYMWRFPSRRDDTIGKIVGGPTFAEGLVIFGDSEGAVRALDASKGTLVWTFLAGDAVWSTPTVVDSVVYFGSFDHKFYALSLQKGEPKWDRPFVADGAIITSPIVDGGKVFFGSFDGKFYALNAFSGRPAWQQPFNGDGWFWADPVDCKNGVICATTTNGSVYGINPQTGGEVWSYKELFSDPIVAKPGVLDDQLIVASRSGAVEFLEAASGDELGSYHGIGSEVNADISIHSDVIYINQMDRNIMALSSNPIKQLWKLDVSDKYLENR